MTYRVEPSLRAERDLISIAEHITSELCSPEAAKNLVLALNRAMKSLDTMPKKFALVSDERLARKGIRLISVKNHTIFYTVDDRKRIVTIISIMYGARDWANLL